MVFPALILCDEPARNDLQVLGFPRKRDSTWKAASVTVAGRQPDKVAVTDRAEPKVDDDRSERTKGGVTGLAKGGSECVPYANERMFGLCVRQTEFGAEPDYPLTQVTTHSLTDRHSHIDRE